MLEPVKLEVTPGLLLELSPEPEPELSLEPETEGELSPELEPVVPPDPPDSLVPLLTWPDSGRSTEPWLSEELGVGVDRGRRGPSDPCWSPLSPDWPCESGSDDRELDGCLPDWSPRGVKVTAAGWAGSGDRKSVV